MMMKGQEQPREKLILEGAQALTTSELLIVMIGSGVRGHPVHDVVSELMRLVQDDLTALENFRDFVFSSSTETTTADLDVVDGNEWSIYPNPSNGVFFMSFSSDMNLDHVSVVNLLGQEITSLQLSDLENLSFKLTDSGVYFVNLMEGANVLDTKRILKQ